MAFVAHGVRIVERKGRERKSLDIKSSYAKETLSLPIHSTRI